jgi:hypothetical protein
MSAKQAIINALDTLPPNIVEEVYHYVAFLELKVNKTDKAVADVRPPFGYGCLNGKLQEADDHDWFEPLEDFKEYM